MNALSIISLIIGASGFGCAVWFYVHLYRWARICQHGRIFIAYNNKVKLEGPITEWVEWTRMLKGDERSTGRIIYQANKLRVGISLRPGNSTRITTVTNGFRDKLHNLFTHSREKVTS